MRPTIIVRSKLGRVGFLAVAALCVFLVGQAFWVSGFSAALRLAAYPVLVLVIVWLLWFHPRVQISDTGVAIANPLRSASIPFSAITETTSRGALRVVTERQKYTAWAAPARGGYRESTRPPAASPTIAEGTDLLSISADAATTARLIDEEKLERTTSIYRREAVSRGGENIGQETGWRWNVPILGLLLAAVSWVVFSATY